MEDRPYQKEAAAAIEAEWTGGVKRTLLVLPTGCGKTIVFCRVTEDQVREGGRVLILAHRGELLDQAADKLYRVTGLRCAVEKAEEHSRDSWYRVTVGSVQTLMRESRLAQFPGNYYSHIIVDEYEIIGLNLKSQLNQGFRGLVLFLLTLKIADKAIHRRQYAQNRNLSAERGAASLCSASTRHTLPTYISFRRSTELSARVDLHWLPLRHSTHVPVARAA